MINPTPPHNSKYLKNNIFPPSAHQHSCPDLTLTACCEKNRPKTFPKIHSSTRIATASEKAIPAVTVMNVIKVCICVLPSRAYARRNSSLQTNAYAVGFEELIEVGLRREGVRLQTVCGFDHTAGKPMNSGYLRQSQASSGVTEPPALRTWEQAALLLQPARSSLLHKTRLLWRAAKSA